MKSLAEMMAPLRTLDLERLRGLRPNYPPVSVEFERGEMVLVRLKRKRGRLLLEAHRAVELPESSVGASIFRPNLGVPDEVAEKVKQLLVATGTRAGRISVILPDNLARISILSLPERPTSRKQLTEIIKFKLRRTVPFRLDDAVISYQNLPGQGKEANILVALILRSVVEQYERVFESVGARPGLVDLSTPNVFNLCRPQMEHEAQDGRDVALLNCARTYFSLLILQGGRLVFFRCKSYQIGEGDAQRGNGIMARELTTSLSYYREKLGGEEIGTIFVRSVGKPLTEMTAFLEERGFARVVPVDPTPALSLAEGLKLDLEVGQKIAPAVGAAAGRG